MSEIDEVIAKKVMGLHEAEEEGFWPNKSLVWRNAAGVKISDGCTPRYSTDIRLAWTILDKFNADGWVTSVGSKRYIDSRELVWYALIGMAKPIDEFDMNANILGEAEAPTPAMAICLTALQAFDRLSKRKV